MSVSSLLSLPNVTTGHGWNGLSNGSSPHGANSSINGYLQDENATDQASEAEEKSASKTGTEYASSVDGQAKAATEDANLKNIWDEEMSDFEPTGRPHRNTAVLMISWVAEANDLNDNGKLTAELCDLETVFREVFHYDVIKREITGGPRDKPPGVQVTKHLLELVYTYDSDSTLLIVYYAGHGFEGKSGGLHLAGNRQPNGPEPTARNAAAWKDSEHVIRDTQGDVLLIFDCCFAGILLGQSVRSWSCYPTRRFECLAACGSQQTTRFPGKDSFTSALIWALTELGKARKRFTTLELQTKIMKEAPEFPRGQFVPLLERGEPCHQRLVLAPQIQDPTSPASTSNYLNEPLRHYMDLRFWFPSRPNEEQVANLAKLLKQLMRDGSIGARRIRLEGLTDIDLKAREKNIVQVAVSKWKSLMSASSSGSATTAPLDPDILSSGSRTRLPSVLSILESTHPAIKYDQVAKQTSSDHDDKDVSNHYVQTEPYFKPDPNTYKQRFAALHGLLGRQPGWIRSGASKKAQIALTVLGVLSLGFGVWYTFPFRPFSILRFWGLP